MILKISNNELTELPAKLGSLSELTELHADGNKLIALPETIGGLSKLILLNISTSKTGQTRNQIEKFPASFGKLINVEVLNMTGTYMMALPTGIEKMQKLKTLAIDWCGLTSLDEVKNCKQLEELYASNNYFDRIPDWIGNLSALRILKLDGNFFPNKAIPHILVCPKSIGQLTELEELSLNDQLLDKLPDEIGNLKKLKTLNIRNNKLENLPVSIAQCIALEMLDVKANLLKELPDLNALPALTYLNLSFNPDLNIDSNAGKFSKLKALKKLDLSYNNISKSTLQLIRDQYPMAEVIYFSLGDLKFNPDKKN
jgi:Leucine-rich repeat (LRR) protein